MVYAVQRSTLADHGMLPNPNRQRKQSPDVLRPNLDENSCRRERLFAETHDSPAQTRRPARRPSTPNIWQVSRSLPHAWIRWVTAGPRENQRRSCIHSMYWTETGRSTKIDNERRLSRYMTTWQTGRDVTRSQNEALSVRRWLSAADIKSNRNMSASTTATNYSRRILCPQGLKGAV